MTYSIISDGDTGLKVRNTLNQIIQDANDGRFSASKKDDITLLQSGWTFSSNLWSYDHFDNDIKLGYVVDFVPYNDDIDTVIDAEILPYNSVVEGKTIFFSRNEPLGDIKGELIILGTI